MLMCLDVIRLTQLNYMCILLRNLIKGVVCQTKWAGAGGYK